MREQVYMAVFEGVVEMGEALWSSFKFLKLQSGLWQSPKMVTPIYGWSSS